MLNLSDPSLVAGVTLFLIWLLATRFLLLWAARRLRSGTGHPFILAFINGYFYGLPLLLAPIIGVAEWRALIVGVLPRRLNSSYRVARVDVRCSPADPMKGIRPEVARHGAQTPRQLLIAVLILRARGKAGSLIRGTSLGHLAASRIVNATGTRVALLWLAFIVAACVPFAVVEDRTGAVVENHDHVPYLLDIDRGDTPGGVGRGLTWALPPDTRAWAFDVPGSGRADLVLFSTSCMELDRVAVDGTVIAVIEGGRFSSVTALGQLSKTPPVLEEGRHGC